MSPNAHSPLPVSYTARGLSRVLKLGRGQLRRWQGLGLFPRQARYGWEDLLRARRLRACGASPQASRRLSRCLEALRRRCPDLDDPLLQARFEVFADGVAVRYQGVFMDALSGQLRLPFAGAPANLAPPATRAQRRRERAHQEAERWFAFGLSLEGEPEKRAQAASAYERCLELDSSFGSAHINLGTIRYHQKNYAAAERCYREALRLDPDYALAYFNLGNVLDETGQLAHAVEAYLEALRLAPGYADAHYNLALAFQRMGQQRRALSHWRSYLGLDQQSAWANYARRQLKQILQRDVLQLVLPA